MNSIYRQWYQDQYTTIIEQLSEFLSYPTVSTQPDPKAFAGCIEFLYNYLEKAGLEVEIWPTKDHPTIFARSKNFDPNHPTVLFYGHYDVQPPSPLQEWNTDPFVATIRDNTIYARGAIDNKGQIFYTLAAINAFMATDQESLVNIKIIIEGGEEIGSQGLFSILEEKSDSVAAEYVLMVDMDSPGKDLPAITLGCRGIVTLEVHVKSGVIDAHSGLLGGIMANPALALAQSLAAVVDPVTNTIQLPEFYTGIHPLTESEKKLIALDLPVEAEAKNIGVIAFRKEEGCSFVEANWLRPTFEINGIYAGYIEPGFKTVLPASATAKVSCRLVPSQDPAAILQILRKHFLHTLSGYEVSFAEEKGSPAFRTSPEKPFAQIIKEAYKRGLGKDPLLILGGGSLPIAQKLAQATGGDVLGIGFAILSDGMHAPNEHFGLDRFELGFMAVVSILDELSRR